jgi:hypothetical protein
VLSLSHRLSAVLVALVLGAGQAGACAGWMPTAEARMACCSDDGPCPMHQSKSQNGPTDVVTQAEADRCCAASGQDDSAPSPSTVGFFVTLGIVISPIPALLLEPEARADTLRAAVPMPTGHVPKHLLLSVFLV